MFPQTPISPSTHFFLKISVGGTKLHFCNFLCFETIIFLGGFDPSPPPPHLFLSYLEKVPCFGPPSFYEVCYKIGLIWYFEKCVLGTSRPMSGRVSGDFLFAPPRPPDPPRGCDVAFRLSLPLLAPSSCDFIIITNTLYSIMY